MTTTPWTPPTNSRPDVYVWKIEEFLKFAPLIDCNPIGQRPPVEATEVGSSSKPSKAQSIINSIFKGSDIGEIKLASIKSDQFQYESVDGGHRKRTIIGFVKGDFPTHKSSVIGSKYYGALTEEERDYFLNFTFRVVHFGDLTPEEKGILFRDTNTVTEVNHMEMLNSYGDIPIANAIRNMSRYIPTVGNSFHDLFSNNYSVKQRKHIYTYVSFDNARLRIDEIVARLFRIGYAGNGKLTTASNADLEAMYRDPTLDNTAVSKLTAKVKDVLDFLIPMSNARKYWLKKPLNNAEFVLLYRLYFHYNEKYGSWKIDNVDAFFRSFKTAMQQFDRKDPSDFAKGTFKLKSSGSNADSSDRLIHEAFHGYIGDHVSMEKARQLIAWIEHFFDPFKEGSAIVLDKKRTFTHSEKENALAKQMFKDPITKKNLTLHDGVGGHIEAHSKGGFTNIDNLMVLSKEVNSEMGAINALEYSELKNK